MFEGSLHDDKTLPGQIEKLRVRFRLGSVIGVSDRGMVTKANLELRRAADGAAWITALKAQQVRSLMRKAALRLSLFDEQNVAEIASEERYPGERLLVCRNPLSACSPTTSPDRRLAWKSLLFDDEQPPQQPDSVVTATRSKTAERKAQTKRTTSGEPCRSLKALLEELETLTRNTVRRHGNEGQLRAPHPAQPRHRPGPSS